MIVSDARSTPSSIAGYSPSRYMNVYAIMMILPNQGDKVMLLHYFGRMFCNETVSS